MKYATYDNLRDGILISNGDYMGTIDTVCFDMVLVRWGNDLAPFYYPRDVWNFRFGSNFTIIENEQPV